MVSMKSVSSPASPSQSGVARYNFVARAYVGEPYKDLVEQAIDSAIVDMFGSLGYAYSKGASRFSTGQNALRDGQLDVPYQFSGPISLGTISTQERFANAIAEALRAQSPVSYAYFLGETTADGSRRRAIVPGSARDVTIWATGESEPTRTISQVGGGINPSERSGKILDESYYEGGAPAAAGGIPTSLLVGGLVIGGLVLWTIAESRKRG